MGLGQAQTLSSDHAPADARWSKEDIRAEALRHAWRMLRVCPELPRLAGGISLDSAQQHFVNRFLDYWAVHVTLGTKGYRRKESPAGKLLEEAAEGLDHQDGRLRWLKQHNLSRAREELDAGRAGWSSRTIRVLTVLHKISFERTVQGGPKVRASYPTLSDDIYAEYGEKLWPIQVERECNLLQAAGITSKTDTKPDPVTGRCRSKRNTTVHDLDPGGAYEEFLVSHHGCPPPEAYPEPPPDPLVKVIPYARRGDFNNRSEGIWDGDADECEGLSPRTKPLQREIIAHQRSCRQEDLIWHPVWERNQALAEFWERQERLRLSRSLRTDGRTFEELLGEAA